ncbi:MAG: DUF4215 domain-containing protein [Myxococcales bacterium]|nr:DUF4215 domain-containing protein [Myxococcales bacterium]
MTRHLIFATLAVPLVAAVWSCGPSEMEALACVPGATQLCVGPGVCSGAQVCSDDGSRWGACECGSAQGGGGAGGHAGGAPGGAGGTGGSGGAAFCGDGQIATPAESCDDGNTTATDGCDGSCAVEAGFTCSDEPSVCQGICGDGLVKGAEGCDDQDTQSGDGCSAGCAVEPGYVCSGVPSVCLPDTICGNCVVGPTEQCDDGNGVDLDGCRSDCTRSPVVVGVVGTNAAAQIILALDALGESYTQVAGFAAPGSGGVLLTSIDGNSGNPPNYAAAIFGGAHVAVFGGDAVPSFTTWVGNYLTTDGTAQWLDSNGCTPQWSTVGASTITSLLPLTYDFPISAASFHMLHFMDAQANGGVVVGRTCDRQTNAGIMATRRFGNAGTLTSLALQLGVNCSGACRTDFLQPLLEGYLKHVRSCVAPAPGECANQPALTPCSENGGTVCNGIGACVECVTTLQCQAPEICNVEFGTPYQCACPNNCQNQTRTCGTISDGCGGFVNCNNGVKDGTETDVNCGGTAAPNSTCNIACGAGKLCIVNSDCASNVCFAGSPKVCQ